MYNITYTSLHIHELKHYMLQTFEQQSSNASTLSQLIITNLVTFVKKEDLQICNFYLMIYLIKLHSALP